EGACESCHPGPWWAPATLGDNDHAVTGFPLRGQHALTACEDCHPEGTPRGSTPADCAGCHRQDDPHRNLLGNRCDDCHDEVSWFKTRFRHETTGWPLAGLHRVVECNACHAVAFVGTPTTCWRCHEAEAPRDVQAHQSAFFAQCDDCHTPYGWAAVRYAH
ncbi:MAG: cytochrome c3 family protein, partial [Myxococcales bacterium]|nr:cytochrome c3 family protein [Myxococcales bacterium]